MPLNEKPYLQSVSLDSSSDDEAGGYPFNIPAVRDVGKLRFHPDVTFFVGENGAGKSTVLEALALALGFSPEGVRETFSCRPLHRPRICIASFGWCVASGVRRMVTSFARRAFSMSQRIWTKWGISTGTEESRSMQDRMASLSWHY